MPETRFPYLCGGVLYFLLAQTKASRGTARDHRNGIKDDHSDPIMMGDLIYTFTGSTNFGASKDTSLYRECGSEGSINVPFNDSAYASAYDSTVKFHYAEALSRMCEFVGWHLNDKKDEWLVKALIDIIERDSDISDENSFYINSDGHPSTKAEIRTMAFFEIQPVLVGIVHYVLTCRMNCNHLGITTLDKWGEKKNRSERRYNGDAGNGITRQIDVKRYNLAAAEESDQKEKTAPLEDPEEPETEHVESEVVDDDGRAYEQTEDSEADAAGNAKTVIIHQQTNVIQHGPNNNQITNNGTMVFDFRKGGK